jgi:Fe-S-cluster containining protein
MPATLEQALADNHAALFAGRTPDRVKEELPCLWFDAETLRCRHYDYRPPMCREFEVSEEDCLAWRKRCGIGCG